MGDYDTQLQERIFSDFEEKITDLIRTLISEEGITIHAIESRVKERDSLIKKIEKKEDKYSSIQELTDIVGLRIITYFEDDVDKIANLINEEFYLDKKNSIDKRDKSPDSFGYSSLHYILKLNETRANLREYLKFNDCKFELQIRSILQHAWAEIEHDLGYKSKVEIPEEIRRDFSRIAGLLELADKEFIRIKSFLNSYSSEMEFKIREHDLNIPIDKITLKEYLFSSHTVEGIMKNIYNESVLNNIQDKEILVPEMLLKSLTLFNITTISQLDEILEENKDSIPKFIEAYNSDLKEPGSTIAYDIVIIYLIYVTIYRDYSKEKLIKFINIFDQDERSIEQSHSTLMKLLDEELEI